EPHPEKQELSRTDRQELAALSEWVHQGGLLILADDQEDFASALGLTVHSETLENAPTTDPVGRVGDSTSGSRDLRIAAGATLVTADDPTREVWAEAGGHPLVTVHKAGSGQVWLVNRPEFVQNQRIGKADNAVLLRRLIDAALFERPGEVAVDEYFHGLRDRPGVWDLLFTPPLLWVTLQGLALLALILW